ECYRKPPGQSFRQKTRKAGTGAVADRRLDRGNTLEYRQRRSPAARAQASGGTCIPIPDLRGTSARRSGANRTRTRLAHRESQGLGMNVSRQPTISSIGWQGNSRSFARISRSSISTWLKPLFLATFATHAIAK